MKASDEQTRNNWVSIVCRAKDSALLERKELLEVWKKEDQCISCIAMLASEQQEEEEKQFVMVSADM